MRPRGLAALALLVSLGACHGQGPAPETAFTRFVAAAAHGDRTLAWSLLSAETRAAADHLGQQQSPPVDGKTLLLGGGLALAHGVTRIRRLKSRGDDATLEIRRDDGSKQDVEMRREDGKWKVVLPIPDGT